MNDTEKAIKKFNYLGNGAPINNVLYGMNRKEKREMFLSAAKALEKQLNGGCISVNERLPKEKDFYIFQLTGGKRHEYYYEGGKLYTDWLHDEEYLFDINKNVIAWQPLPEPYKEVVNE